VALWTWTTSNWSVGRRAEVYRFVVGPIENNVYVVRCKRTGEATLIDAANEHDGCCAWRVDWA